MKRASGMTLLEILVSLFIAMIVMAVLFLTYTRTMRARARIERTSELAAGARAVLELLRRDLQGAIRLAAETYDFGNDYARDREFHWEAELPPSGSRAFRRLSFVAAIDGGRDPNDELRPYDYGLVTWSVRGGSLMRKTGRSGLTLVAGSKPAGWQEVSSPPGISTGGPIYTDDGGTALEDVGPYRGAPYIRTASAEAGSSISPSTNLEFKDAEGNLVPVMVTVAVDAARASLPLWLSNFSQSAGQVVAGGAQYKPYSKACPGGRVYLGPNDGPGSRMYFVIVEPLWWSVGEDVVDIIFRPPPEAEYTLDRTEPEKPVGKVPKWIDIELYMGDPDHPMGRRKYSQRIGIPTGE